MNKELVVVLPAYNEERDIELLIAKWEEIADRIEHKYSLGLRIVVINDGSIDLTRAKCEKLEKTYPNFVNIRHDENEGMGKSLETGFLYAIHGCPECEYVVSMDCNNTQEPHYIEAMLDKMLEGEADVVLASRYQVGSVIHGLSRQQQFIDESTQKIYSKVLKIEEVTDYCCNYRLYSKVVLDAAWRKYGEDWIQEVGSTCLPEILYKLYCIGAKFKEVPFDMNYYPTMNPVKKNGLKATTESLKLANQLRKLK